MALYDDYEVSSSSAVRHWEVPYARLEDTTPSAKAPAAVKSRTNGKQMVGTVLSLDAARSIAVIDFTNSMVFAQDVRNVLTYAAGVEATWGEIKIGDPIYYDRSQPAATVWLSTSPLDNTGSANPLYGFVVINEGGRMQETPTGSFPKGNATAGTFKCAISQVGVVG